MKIGGSNALALVPIGALVLFGSLLLPRAAEPDAVPLPHVNARALAATEADDAALARKAREQELDGDIRELGSKIRAFHELEATNEATPGQLHDARTAVNRALPVALTHGTGPLLALRAVQLERFVSEVQAFEKNGKESSELVALGGGFVRRMREEGWCRGKRLLISREALRVLFKEMWNAFLGLEQEPEFRSTLDEMRALYALFLAFPHPSQGDKLVLESVRATAKTPESCAAISASERAASEKWRLDRIKRFASIDPEYPAAYARGVVLFRLGNFDAAADAFRDWLRDHPDGPFSLRARNHLRATSAEM